MSRQKHLLHIFPTFAVGGSQIRFGQLARLHGDRYRHTVIALGGDYGMAARLEGSNVAIHKISFDKRNIFWIGNVNVGNLVIADRKGSAAE